MSGYEPSVVPVIFGVSIALRIASKSTGAGKKKARTKGPKAVVLTKTLGDQELERLRLAAERGDWTVIEAILEPVRARGDYERLTWLIGKLDDVSAAPLIKLGTEHPESALARTVAGARRVAWAWEARTGYRASQVSREQFQTFFERLRGAEEDLYAAVELDPASAAPWYTLTMSSRGLQHGHAVTRRRFEAGIARAPHHVGLHRQMLQQLCQKWSGSHEQMHSFARESMLTAPEGSGLGELVAIAHLEHWLELPAQEKTGYIQDPAVRAELTEAAARSVDHPAFAPTSTPYNALNTFAMAFWLAGDRDSAARMFKKIGDNATEFPWQYKGAPGTVFAAARQDCKKRK